MDIHDAVKDLDVTAAELVKCKVLLSMVVKLADGRLRIPTKAIERLSNQSRLHVREESGPDGYYELRLEEPK